MRKIVLSLLLAPSLALASGYSLPNTNSRDLGLSASGIAAQRDSGAAFALPAALARIEGPSVRLGLGGVNVFNTWTDPTGASPETDMDNAIAAIGNVAVSYGGRVAALGDRGWGVGFGIQPFGGAIVDWPSGWEGRFRIVEVDRRSFSGILSAGIEVIPRVRLGAGLLYYYTMQEFTQKAWMAPFAGATPADVTNPATWNPALPDAEAKLDMSGGAFSYSLSLEVDPLPAVPLTFAVDYKHKASQELDGDVEWTGLTPLAGALGNAGPAAGAAAIFKNQGVEQTLTIPNLLNVGVAYRVIPALLLTAGFTWDRWVVYDQDRFVADNGAVLAVPRDYSNGQTYRVGAEYTLNRSIELRAGLQRDESGLSKTVYSPTLPDGSSWAGSLGATYKFGRGFSVDAVVFYAMMDDVEVPSSAAGLEPQATPPTTFIAQPTGTFRGEYSPSALVYGLGLAWSPGARTPAE